MGSGAMVSSVGNVVTNEILLAELREIRLGQEAMRVSIQAEMADMRQELGSLVDSKLSSFKVSIDKEMQKLSSSLRMMEDRITTVESECKRQGERTEAVAATVSDDTCMLVIKNLPYSASAAEEDESQLRKISLTVLQDTGAGVQEDDLVSVARAKTGPVTKPVLVVLRSKEKKTAILKNKSKLRASTKYKAVFIDKARSRQERAFNTSMRHITRKFPDLEFRRGMVQPSLLHQGQAAGTQ